MLMLSVNQPCRDVYSCYLRISPAGSYIHVIYVSALQGRMLMNSLYQPCRAMHTCYHCINPRTMYSCDHCISTAGPCTHVISEVAMQGHGLPLPSPCLAALTHIFHILSPPRPKHCTFLMSSTSFCISASSSTPPKTLHDIWSFSNSTPLLRRCKR